MVKKQFKMSTLSNEVNEQIKQNLENRIATSRQYFDQKSIRDSVEDYKAYLIHETNLLKAQNNPDNDWAIQNNLEVLETYYNDFLEALKMESEFKKVMKRILNRFDKLDKMAITNGFIRQLVSQLPKVTIKENYKSISGLFFHFDSQPFLQMTCFPKQNFKLIIEPPEYVKYENGDYASDVLIEINFSKVAQPIFNEIYEEIAWKFEYEPEYFRRMKQLHIDFSFLCLHSALKSAEIAPILNRLPLENGALFYAGEHDEKERTIFVKDNNPA